MNNTRRKAIDKVAKNIERLSVMVEEIMSTIEAIVADENEAVENVPENLQGNFDYDSSESALELLDNTTEELLDVQQSPESAFAWLVDTMN